MKAPKILPWIARKAGISDQLALNLWRRAAGESEELTGCCDSSDYYQLAVERFIDLAEEEGEKCRELDPLSIDVVISRINWMRRYQERLWQTNLLAAQGAWRVWHSNWMTTLTGHKQTA
jgi:hypothetical protein